MGLKRDDIENHILKLIKQHPLLYKGYLEFKSEIERLMNNKNEKAFLISTMGGNKDYFRLNPISPAYNSFYYFFEIEKILTSKFGVRYKYKDLIPLSFKFRIFPLFSFTLDSSTFSIYWRGKEEESHDLLDLLKFLKKINWSSTKDKEKDKPIILLKAKDSTKVQFSSLKFIASRHQLWPEKLDDIDKLGSFYIFNWLYPPKNPGKLEEIWWDSPFIFFDNSELSPYFEIFLVNKTVSYSNGNYVKILNSDLKWVDVSNLCKTEAKGLNASIMVRKFTYDQGLKGECRILAMDSIKLSDNEVLGSGDEIPYTLVSIILRHQYLSSTHPFRIEKKDAANKVKELLGDPIFKSYLLNFTTNQLGWRLLDPNNIDFMIKALGVYEVNRDSIIYLHPVLYEALEYLKTNGVTTTADKLIEFVNSLIDSKNLTSDPNEPNKKVRDYFNISVAKNGIMNLSVAITHLPKVISFSKKIKGEHHGS